MSLIVRGNFDNRNSLYLLCYRQHKVHVHRKKTGAIYFTDTWGAICTMVGGFENTASHCSGDKNKWFDNSSAFTLQELQEDQQKHHFTTVHRLDVLRKHFIATPQYKFNQSGWHRPELQDWSCLSWKEKLLWWLGLAQELGQPLPSCFQNTVPPWLFLGGMRRT